MAVSLSSVDTKGDHIGHLQAPAGDNQDPSWPGHDSVVSDNHHQHGLVLRASQSLLVSAHEAAFTSPDHVELRLPHLYSEQRNQVS